MVEKSIKNSKKYIKVLGSREHNLKNISVDIPKEEITVITGLSGSGKSSLAFDTIYAEGQRRYVESLSAYARQFLEMMQKPDVDQIEGLSPAISIEQKTTSKNPRSTVGTVTEIHDYLRLMFARIGIPHSPETGLPIKSQTVTEMVDQALKLKKGTKVYLLSPIVRERKGEYKKEFSELLKKGFQRVKIDGEFYEINNVPILKKNFKVARRSKKDQVDSNIEVLLGDTMGELNLLYSVSDIAFVGGSLIDHGGQNIIEPASLGKPICSGPNLRNFEDVAMELEKAEALKIIYTSKDITNYCLDLLNNEAEIQRLGEASLLVTKKNKGALQKILSHLAPYLDNNFLKTT